MNDCLLLKTTSGKVAEHHHLLLPAHRLAPLPFLELDAGDCSLLCIGLGKGINNMCRSIFKEFPHQLTNVLLNIKTSQLIVCIMNYYVKERVLDLLRQVTVNQKILGGYLIGHQLQSFEATDFKISELCITCIINLSIK